MILSLKKIKDNSEKQAELIWEKLKAYRKYLSDNTTLDKLNAYIISWDSVPKEDIKILKLCGYAIPDGVF